MKEFNGKELEVSYGQISIFNTGIENPFSDWSREHVEQGFTLRPGAIGIMTINYAGKIKTNIGTSNQEIEEAIRIYVLPFEVKGGKGVEIATITEGFTMMIPDGKYSMLVQIGNENTETDWCSISFVNPSKLDNMPKIIKADTKITRRQDLILDAKPA